jgi:hypothetical protein
MSKMALSFHNIRNKRIYIPAKYEFEKSVISTKINYYVLLIVVLAISNVYIHTCFQNAFAKFALMKK